MSFRKSFLELLVIALIVFLPVVSLRAEEDKPIESHDESVSERRNFNKLKRSTQNIYKVTMRSTVVYRLQTALGYVSTIDLPEKALKVFVGDQELFKVGVYEKQVLVKPITDERDAKTNLVIVTESGRLAFDVSVGPPDTADFVLDFRLPQDDEMLVENAFEKKVEEKTEELEKSYKGKEEKLEKKAEEIAEVKLKEKIASEARTIPLKASSAKENIQVNLLSLSQVGDKAYLRFSILNYSQSPYRAGRAMVGVIKEERKLLRKQQTGTVEFPSELSLPDVIAPDSYVYGVIAFDYRALGKNEKPFFRIFEDIPQNAVPPTGRQNVDVNRGRAIEITGFPWFE